MTVSNCPNWLEIFHAGRQIHDIFTVKPRFQDITLLFDFFGWQALGEAQQQAGAGLAQRAAAHMCRRGVDNAV